MLDEIKKIKMLKIDRKRPVYITREELSDMIDMGMSFCTFIDPLKLKVILTFLFYTGVRKGEFLNLKREDINLKEEVHRQVVRSNKITLAKYYMGSATIRIPTKTKEERKVYFPLGLAKELQKYYDEVEPHQDTNAFNITVRQLLHIISFVKDFLPKEKRDHFSVHTFRHSFAMMLVQKIGDIRKAQKLLGHKSINSTLFYYDPDEEMIKQVYSENIK